jgi:CheY-like chemotaxis protein
MEGWYALDRKSVLLVDDNSTHQYSLGKHLEESGFTVLRAETGAATLELAGEHHPDAILLDINLPDMTGFEICERLKADPGTGSIPVIFHSATHDTQAAKAQAIDLGALSFLSYPINIEHLVSVLKGAITHTQEMLRNK